MRNGGKKDLVPYSPAYRDLIQLRSDDLRGIATRALEMPGIEESEQDNIERALKLLDSIDELVKILDKRPSHVQQAHALVHLWKVIGAVFIIGSRGIENPLTEKFRKDKRAQSTAHARNAKPSTKYRDQINKVVKRHSGDHTNPRRQNPNAKAIDILEAVNSDLAKLGITLTHESLRKKISSLKLAG